MYLERSLAENGRAALWDRHTAPLTSEDTYKTLAGISEGLYKEKGSRFIAIARSVVSEDEVAGHLHDIRKQYHDARHHAYAWILGADGILYRSNDDGEPGHSAGDPILGQIRSRDLTDTVVVVVRYFGGTRLGVGGLIHAYRMAAADALEHNTIVTKTIRLPVVVHFPYDQTGPVMRLIDEFNAVVASRQFESSCTTLVRVKRSDTPRFVDRIRLIPDTRAETGQAT